MAHSNSCEQIAVFPLSCRPVPEYQVLQVREVLEGTYRIIYHIKPDQVDIIAVVHGSRSLTAEETAQYSEEG